MEFEPLELDGVFGIASTAKQDDRGSFLRVWDSSFFASYLDLSQGSVAVNTKSLTLRGLHFQSSPNAETKIIECIQGEVFDVVVDIREGSSSYGTYVAVRLGPNQKYQGVLAPKGYAHGYLTLEPNSILLYFMDQPYVEESAKGILWNDPDLHIAWPDKPEVISERDRNFPRLVNL